jgi:hypothetical protein
MNPQQRETQEQTKDHTPWQAQGRSTGFEEQDSRTVVHEAGESEKLPPSPQQRYAIIQFDSRKNENGTYWHTSSKYNAAYCHRHGHVYKYYTLPADDKTCMSFDGTVDLAHPWCKVKTMLRAHDDLPGVDYFLYMDSDAIVSFQFGDLPLNALFANMTQKLNWNVLEKPVVFNQDGKCWWCNVVLKNSSYTKACLNTGTVAWYRSDRAKQVLQKWWESAMDSAKHNPLGIQFRTQWPWEQERAMALYHNTHDQNGDNVSSYIQLASQPERFYMEQNQDWCLSHLQKANCFIAHHCIDEEDKKLMMTLINAHAPTLSDNSTLTIDFL